MQNFREIYDTMEEANTLLEDVKKTHGGARSGAGRPSSGLGNSVPVRVTAEVRKELERMAKTRGVAISTIVRIALGEWLQGK